MSALDTVMAGLQCRDVRVGESLQEVCINFCTRWINDIEVGSSADLLSEVDDLIEQLHAFKELAREALPVANGGFGGLTPDFWANKLSAAGVIVYESGSSPGLYGYTNCDFDWHPSFNIALHKALVLNPQVVKAVHEEASIEGASSADESVSDVVEHVLKMSSKYDFTPDEASVGSAISDSAQALGLTLNESQIASASEEILSQSNQRYETQRG